MLHEQLKHRIEQEAKDYANIEICDWGKIQNGWQLHDWELTNDVYKDAAEVYAEKWQAAEQRAERYEKALSLIAQMSDPGDYWVAICKMKSIAADALTNKTSTDE